MKWALAALVVCACGKHAEDKSQAAPAKPSVPADAARVAIAADAAVDAGHAAMTPVDPNALPAWDVPAGQAKGPTVELYAADMDGDRLLGTVGAGQTLIATPSGKKLTGRVSAPRGAVYATLVAQLGIDATPPKVTGHGASVDLSFAAAPVTELVRLLADVGRVNIVAPEPLSAVDIIVKRRPWDGVLTAVLEKSGRTVTRTGNMFYALPAGTTLPDAPKVPAVEVELDMKDATIGQAIAALRELTDVPVAACDSKPFSLHLRRVQLGEALRALQVETGATLLPGTTCKTSKLDAGAVADAKLHVIARVGTKRAAAFERNGEILTATVDGTVVTDIFDGSVSLGSTTKQLTPDWQPPASGPDALIARVRRVAAIVHDGDRWIAYVETLDGAYELIDPSHTYDWPAWVDLPRIDTQGIHLTMGPTKTVDLLLGR